MKSGLRSNSSRARTCCYQLMLARNHKFWLHRTLISLEAANQCVWSVLGCKSFQNPSSSPLPLEVLGFGVKGTENSGVEPELTELQTEGLEGGWSVERKGGELWEVQVGCGDKEGGCGCSGGM